MTLPYKLLAGIILLLAAAGIGYYYGNNNVKEQIVYKDVIREQIVEKIVTKTVIRRPDGTVEEIVREEDRQTDSKTNSEGTRTVRNVSPNYRASAALWAGSPSSFQQPSGANLGVGISRRIVGPAWIEVQARPLGNKKEVAVGVAWEF